MGCTGSSLSTEERDAQAKEKQRNRDIERKNKEAEDADRKVKKLLLLGAGESGKSTLFKQMITLYGKGFSEEDRQTYRHVVYNNTLEAMKVLLEQSVLLAEEGFETSIKEESSENKDVIVNAKLCIMVHEYQKLDQATKEQVGAAVYALWQDPGIKACYGKRAGFQLMDSASYFFDRALDIVKFGYIPTEQDVLRTRVRTTGIVETTFEVDNALFTMFDVGGQRNERKKWIHCFENVKAVVFVAAISEYDQVLFEDDSTNRVWESLELFAEICNSRWFRNTSIMLFLNKRDLFEDKVRRVPLTVCFPEFTGDVNSYEECRDFMQAQFESENKNKHKHIYTHVTCATDTNNIKVVFDVVAGTIIREKLEDAGFF